MLKTKMRSFSVLSLSWCTFCDLLLQYMYAGLLFRRKHGNLLFGQLQNLHNQLSLFIVGCVIGNASGYIWYTIWCWWRRRRWWWCRWWLLLWWRLSRLLGFHAWIGTLTRISRLEWRCNSHWPGLIGRRPIYKRRFHHIGIAYRSHIHVHTSIEARIFTKRRKSKQSFKFRYIWFQMIQMKIFDLPIPMLRKSTSCETGKWFGIPIGLIGGLTGGFTIDGPIMAELFVMTGGIWFALKSIVWKMNSNKWQMNSLCSHLMRLFWCKQQQQQNLTTAVCGSTIRITTIDCSSAYDSCGFNSSICRASAGLFWMHNFICFISSYICSGGSDATVFVIVSGASSGSQCSPYGFSTCGPCNNCCISIRDFSVQALSTRSVRPPISYPFKFRIALKAVSWSLYSQKPYPFGLPLSRSNTSLFEVE